MRSRELGQGEGRAVVAESGRWQLGSCRPIGATASQSTGEASISLTRIGVRARTRCPANHVEMQVGKEPGLRGPARSEGAIGLIKVQREQNCEELRPGEAFETNHLARVAQRPLRSSRGCAAAQGVSWRPQSLLRRGGTKGGGRTSCPWPWGGGGGGENGALQLIAAQRFKHRAWNTRHMARGMDGRHGPRHGCHWWAPVAPAPGEVPGFSHP